VSHIAGPRSRRISSVDLDSSCAPGVGLTAAGKGILVPGRVAVHPSISSLAWAARGARRCLRARGGPLRERDVGPLIATPSRPISVDRRVNGALSPRASSPAHASDRCRCPGRWSAPGVPGAAHPTAASPSTMFRDGALGRGTSPAARRRGWPEARSRPPPRCPSTTACAPSSVSQRSRLSAAPILVEPCDGYAATGPRSLGVADPARPGPAPDDERGPRHHRARARGRPRRPPALPRRRQDGTWRPPRWRGACVAVRSNPSRGATRCATGW
jgi:hypothetical protein